MAVAVLGLNYCLPNILFLLSNLSELLNACVQFLKSRALLRLDYVLREATLARDGLGRQPVVADLSPTSFNARISRLFRARHGLRLLEHPPRYAKDVVTAKRPSGEESAKGRNDDPDWQCHSLILSCSGAGTPCAFSNAT